MAKDRFDYVSPLRRIFVGGLVLLLFAFFVLWRVDGPRGERVRAAVVDTVVPSMEWALGPAAWFAEMAKDFESYTRIYEQNRELRRELQQMKAWKEAAQQLEQQNAKLRDLNKVRLDPALTYITSVVLADSGSPFRQSVLLNVGASDGIQDGWATTDGLGVVGRISGVGDGSSRVLLLTDATSRVPVTIQPSGQRAILKGDNSAYPRVEFLESRDMVRPGDRVVSSGDGKVFPAGLLVGHVVEDSEDRLRVQLAADYGRLEFLRVLRSPEGEAVEDVGGLVSPEFNASERVTQDSIPEANGEAPDG